MAMRAADVHAWLAALAETSKDDAGRSVLTLETILRLSAESGHSVRQIDAAALALGVAPVRYLRNQATFSTADQGRLAAARVVLVGLGGLGGGVLESLARMGVGEIWAADGDVFEESNLNRQALATRENLGQRKADAAVARVRQLNPAVELHVWPRFLDREGMQELCARVDLAIDALGGIEARPALRAAAAAAGVPLVSAAVAGWCGYVALIPPGGTGPDQFFSDPSATAERDLGAPGPTVDLAASLQSGLALRVLSGQQKPAAKTSVLFFDLTDWSFETVEL